MDLLSWITQACTNLTNTISPSVDSMGVHICISLATIMLVWFGVQEALACANGGSGFNIGKFLSFFMLITFAYVLVKFYDSSHSGNRLLAEGLYQRRCAVPCHPDWNGQCGEHYFDFETGGIGRRTRHDVSSHEPV